MLGRFELVRRLGSGSSGVVYEAKKARSEARVALKYMGRLDGGGIEAIKREFRSLSDVIHPNLVLMHELFEDHGLWYLSMELVQGVRFTDWVRPQGALDEVRLRDALSQLSRALDVVHAAGKLHGDLKPSNVMVTPAGRVVVLDFGLARELRPHTQRDLPCDGFVGTPAYVSPEQVAGAEPTPASDWYALGVMLFEALTGALPFGCNANEALRQKQRLEPRHPAWLVPELPTDLCRLCVGLLRRDRAARLDSHAVSRVLQGGSECPTPAGAHTSSAPGWAFVGRGDELQAFEHACARAQRAEQAVLLVAGRSGIGKSALLEHFVCQAKDAVVLRGRCHVREFVPYKSFDGVIDALAALLRSRPGGEVRTLLSGDLGALVRVFPVLGQVRAIRDASRAEHVTAGDDRELRNAAFASLKALLRRLTQRELVVMVIDDLHWSDRDSALMLEHVLGAPDAPALVFVGAYRDDEVEHSELLRQSLARAQVGADPHATRIVLGPLPNEAASELGQRLLRAQGIGAQPELIEHIATESSGVPFLILEQVQYLVRVRSRQKLASREMLSLSLDAALCDRIDAIPRDARAVLRVLSVVAAPLEHDVALLAAGQSGAGHSCLALLCSVRLVRRRAGDWFEIYHDRVWETVIAHMDVQDIRRVHESVASALEQLGVADPERLFLHYREAGDRDRAGEAALRAAAAALNALAFNRAAELFAQAYDLVLPHDPRRQQIQYQLGQALANAGRGALAAQAFLRAAQAAEPDEALSLRCVALGQYLRTGHRDDAKTLFNALLQETGLRIPGRPSTQLASFALSRALCAVQEARANRIGSPRRPARVSKRVAVLGAVIPELAMFDPVLALAVGGKYLRAALTFPESEHLVHARAWELMSIGTRAIVETGKLRRLRAQLHELADRIDTPYAHGWAHTAESCVSFMLAQHHAARASAHAGEEQFRTRIAGNYFERGFATLVRHSACEQLGALDEVLADLPALQQDARERDDQFALAAQAFLVPVAHLLRNDPAAALDVVQAQGARLKGPFGLYHVWVALRHAEIMLYQGKAREALAYADEQLAHMRRRNLTFIRYIHVSCCFIRARMLLAANRGSLGVQVRRAIRAEVRELKRFEPRPDARSFSTLIQAALAHREGNRRVAIEYLRRLLDQAPEQRVDAQASFAAFALQQLKEPVANSEHCRPLGGVVTDPERWAATFSLSFS